MTTETDEPESSTTLRWLLPVTGALGVLVLVVWWPGCRTYPPVTSRESLTLMKLLYTACNTRDPVRLAKVEQGVSAARKAGKLSASEDRSFTHILGLARDGDWGSAQSAALQFAQDQVGVGHPTSERK